MKKIKMIFLFCWLMPLVSFSQIEEYGISNLEDNILAEEVARKIARYL